MDQKFILVTLLIGIIVIGAVLYHLNHRDNSYNCNKILSKSYKQPEDITSLIKAYKSLELDTVDYVITHINNKNLLLYKLNDERIVNINGIENKEVKYNISKFFKYHINNIYNIYVDDVERKSIENIVTEKGFRNNGMLYFVPNSYDSNIFHNLTDTNSIRYILNEIHSSELYEYFYNFLIRYIYIYDNIKKLTNNSNIEDESIRQCYKKAEDMKVLLYELIINKKESTNYKRLIDLFKTTTISNIVQSKKSLENKKNQIKKIIINKLKENTFLIDDVIVKHNEDTFTLIDYFYYILESY